jgi:putative transposase
MPQGLTRRQTSGQFHFITFSCFERKPLLEASNGYAIFESDLEMLRTQYQFIVAGYGLMPEHVHLLTNEPQQGTLAIALQVLKQRTSKKLKHPNEPHFWQPRYYDFNVFTHDKTVEKLKYIHRNPVTRGLVSKPEDWPWSSFRHYITGWPGTVEIESSWTSFRRERKNFSED